MSSTGQWSVLDKNNPEKSDTRTRTKHAKTKENSDQERPEQANTTEKNRKKATKENIKQQRMHRKHNRKQRRTGQDV